MYKLLRRISSTFKGRLDRRQEDDNEASNAVPQTGSKRRMSDDDEVPNGSLSKRSRANDETRPEEFESDTATPTQEEPYESSATPSLPRKDTEGVRQVTKGVKEVELEDKKGKGKEVVQEMSEDEVTAEPSSEKTEDTPSKEVEPAEVPLPEETDEVADADAESSANDVTESSKDDAPLDAPTVSDSSEEPSEEQTAVSESSDTTIVDPKEDIDTTPFVPVADKQASIAETVVPTRISIPSDDAPSKHQE